MACCLIIAVLHPLCPGSAVKGDGQRRQDRIEGIGNAAGEGSKLCALSRNEYEYGQKLARETDFLELASLPQFQDCYVDALEFSEDNYEL